MFNAIKELNQKRESEVKEKDAEIQALKQQNDSLTERFNELERTVKQLAANKWSIYEKLFLMLGRSIPSINFAHHWRRFEFENRSCLFFQNLVISLVALCSQPWSVAKRIISTTANHFGALGAGSPSGVSLPTAIKIWMSLSVKPSSFAVVVTSRRAGKSLAAQVAIAASIKVSDIFRLVAFVHSATALAHRDTANHSVPLWDWLAEPHFGLNRFVSDRNETLLSEWRKIRKSAAVAQLGRLIIQSKVNLAVKRIEKGLAVFTCCEAWALRMLAGGSRRRNW
jgi:hypothetical protein